MEGSHLAYKRSRFSTRLPTDRLFTESHFWLAPMADGVHRIGMTKFAARMLGEIVEFEFEVEVGASIEVGQAIGWVEGFKAVSELYSPIAGQFVGANPDLESVVAEIHTSPYDRGWLYSVAGEPPADGLDAIGYAAVLDATIDRMLGES